MYIRRAFLCELSVLLLSLSCNLLYGLYNLLSYPTNQDASPSLFLSFMAIAP